jgi:DNA invertase Pin-like site-specific DNA recombinase
VPPEARQRAVGYVRESTEEQGQGFSPDAQREAIRRFAEENGLDLVREYCDFHSGWRKADGRPEFQRLIADAAEDRFDVVLVYHTSRFARNQVEARRYKQMLRERLGIKVVSVTQPLGDDPGDPSAFLSESIHEMFDEYYSVSLSFWTRTGLREKARQGHLIDALPWGYQRDAESGRAAPDPERAPLVRQLFERYASGHESDRSLAAWLNARGARSAKGRPFSKDTVREMLLNSAYCGYVSGLRSKDRSNRGVHEAIVSEELFDRVQEVRTWRARVVTAFRGLPVAQAAALRALRRAHARDSRLAPRRAPLPLLLTALRRRLRPADHTSGTARGAARRLGRDLPAGRGAAVCGSGFDTDGRPSLGREDSKAPSAGRTARPPTRSLCDGRSFEERIHPSAAGTGGGVGADRPTSRRLSRQGRSRAC